MYVKSVLPVLAVVLPLVLLAFVEPAFTGPVGLQASPEEYPIVIAKVTLRKEDGTPSTVFSRGELVFVEVAIERREGVYAYYYPYYYYYHYYYYYYALPEVQPILVLARVTHEDVMWGWGGFGYNITAGGKVTAMPGILIPEDAPTGTYEVTVFVWSNWAQFGGYPLAESYTVEFEVTS